MGITLNRALDLEGRIRAATSELNQLIADAVAAGLIVDVETMEIHLAGRSQTTHITTMVKLCPGNLVEEEEE